MWPLIFFFCTVEYERQQQQIKEQEEKDRKKKEKEKSEKEAEEKRKATENGVGESEKKEQSKERKEEGLGEDVTNRDTDKDSKKNEGKDPREKGDEGNGIERYQNNDEGLRENVRNGKIEEDILDRDDDSKKNGGKGVREKGVTQIDGGNETGSTQGAGGNQGVDCGTGEGAEGKTEGRGKNRKGRGKKGKGGQKGQGQASKYVGQGHESQGQYEREKSVTEQAEGIEDSGEIEGNSGEIEMKSTGEKVHVIEDVTQLVAGNNVKSAGEEKLGNCPVKHGEHGHWEGEEGKKRERGAGEEGKQGVNSETNQFEGRKEGVDISKMVDTGLGEATAGLVELGSHDAPESRSESRSSTEGTNQDGENQPKLEDKPPSLPAGHMDISEFKPTPGMLDLRMFCPKFNGSEDGEVDGSQGQGQGHGPGPISMDEFCQGFVEFLEKKKAMEKQMRGLSRSDDESD